MKGTERWDAGMATGVPERGRLVVQAADRSVGIYRVDGRLYAYENICPHQHGPVCQGLMVDRVVEVIDADQIAHGATFDPSDPHIVCPWHGYEFSIKTGVHAGVDDIRLSAVPVEEIDGRVYIRL